MSEFFKKEHRRSKTIQIPVTEEIYQEIEELATEAGYANIAPYARKLFRKAIERGTGRDLPL